MKRVLAFKTLLVLTLSLATVSCKKSSSSKNSSRATGWKINAKEGGFQYNDQKYKLVDLPGTYSLLSTSQDEEVARNFILFGKPDVTIIVVDASRLERNLNLVLQILEITNKAVLCLNLMDEAKRLEIEIDDRTLARDLGIPVVPTSARSKEGIPELLKIVHQVATGEIKCKPHRIKNIPKNIPKINPCKAPGLVL